MLAVSAYLLDSSYDRSRQPPDPAAAGEGEVARRDGRADATRPGLQARSADLADKSLAERELLLRSVLLDTNVLATGYVDRRGREVAKLRRSGGVELSEKSLSHQPFFERAREHGAYFGPVTFVSQLAGRQGALAKTIEIDVADSEGGVVREALYPGQQFSDVVVATHLGRAGYAYIVDARGAPVAHPNRAVEDAYAGGRLKSLAVLPQVAEGLGRLRPARPRAATSAASAC